MADIVHKAPEATKDNVMTCRLLFKLQYPGRVIESTNLNVDAEISKLSQQAGENPGTHYRRANSLLIQARSRDRGTPLMTIGEVIKGKFAPLSPSENTVPDSVMSIYLRHFRYNSESKYTSRFGSHTKIAERSIHNCGGV